MSIHLDLPLALANHLSAWIKDSNPNGDESAADDIKRYLTDFVDEHTISRESVEAKLHDHLSSYRLTFRNNRIEVYDSGVTLRITGSDRCATIYIDDNEFDSSEDLSRLAGYAEEIENSVWDDDVGEQLINKWFDLEG